MKILNLLAYSNKGYEQNIGDLLIAASLKKYLHKKKDRWAIGYFNREKFDLDKFDLVIIGGGGLYHPGHLQDLESQLNLYTSTAPLALIGLGLSLDGRSYVSLANKKAIKKINKRAFISSVRDQWTYDLLQSLDLKTSLTGCPSLFLSDCYPEIDKQTLKYDIGFNFAASHTPYYQQQSSKVIKFINAVAKNLKGKKIVICHNRKEKKFYQKIFPNTKVFYSDKPQKVLSVYKNCQLIIGMRCHSQIFSQAVQTPALAIPLNEKVSQPIKMAFKSPNKFIVSLDDSLSSVEKKIKYIQKNHKQIQRQQQALKKRLKNNFLKIIKQIHQRFN